MANTRRKRVGLKVIPYRAYVLSECKRQWAECQEPEGYGSWDVQPKNEQLEYFKNMYQHLWDDRLNLDAIVLPEDEAWHALCTFDKTEVNDIKKAITDWQPELNRIADELGSAELLAQLAEEASELSQAEQKLRRVLDGRNPIPATEASAISHLQEEFTDVLLCAVTVGIDKTEVELFIRAKSARWSARVEGDEDDDNLNS